MNRVWKKKKKKRISPAFMSRRPTRQTGSAEETEQLTLSQNSDSDSPMLSLDNDVASRNTHDSKNCDNFTTM